LARAAEIESPAAAFNSNSKHFMASTTARRWLGPAFKLAILALVVWGGHRTIVDAVEKLRQDGWSFERIDFGWLVVCGGLYSLGQLPCGLFWRRVLADMGEEVPRGRVLRAYYIGHLGKYVPGKAVVFVLRIGLIKAAQPLRTGIGVAAIFYETLTTMAVGSVLATAILLFDGAQEWQVTWIAAGLAAGMIVPLSPIVFNTLLRALSRERGEGTAAAARLHPSRYVLSWLGIAVGWLLMGMSLWAAVQSLAPNEHVTIRELGLYTAAIAMAVVGGFVSMLPGGLGVREIAVMELVKPLVPDAAVALAAAVLLRLVTLAAETIVAFAIYPLGAGLRLKKRSLEEIEEASPDVGVKSS
jgi:uncharacterized membrane protein YbhN (UPF0104 family)